MAWKPKYKPDQFVLIRHGTFKNKKGKIIAYYKRHEKGTQVYEVQITINRRKKTCYFKANQLKGKDKAKAKKIKKKKVMNKKLMDILTNFGK